MLYSKAKHFLGDGKYGNNTVLKLCKKYGFTLISKLQSNASLFFEYTGEFKTKPKKYGEKLDYDNIDSKYLVKEEIKDKIPFKAP